MVSRDYTKEVGLSSAQKTVPKPVAAVVLLAIAIGGFFFVHTMIATHHGADVPVAAQSH